MKKIPTEPQHHPHGIVHWERPLIRFTLPGRTKSYVYVEMECGDCKKEWHVRIHEAMQPRTGRCKACASKYAVLNPAKGAASPHYTGTHRINAKGYVDIKLLPGDPWYEQADKRTGKSFGAVRYMAEHRWVMANTLGRMIERWEQVHHIDMDKTNNAPENLILVEHRVHNAITALERENFRLQAEVRRLREALESLQHQQAA